MARSDYKKTLRIGLTGGIASGKTTVAKMFDDLGVSVIDTDVIAREVVRPGEPALEAIRDRFGDAVIDETGNLNRVAMRKLIFANESLRLDIEGILHPLIGVETRRQANAETGPYQIIVVPLLVGSPLMQFVDRVLVVDCDEETQMQRLLTRDSETVEQAQRIIAAQSSRAERLAIGDDIISTDKPFDAIREHVLILDTMYRNLASQDPP